MEGIDIMQSIIENYKPPSVEYMIVYDPDTGEILKVGPSYAFTNEKHKMPIDDDMAAKLIEGQIRMSSCAINMHSGKLEIAEIKTVFKIDDILHRIIDIRWSNITEPDVYLTYNRNNSTLIVELSKHYGGTKLLEGQREPQTVRKVIWDGDTQMNFLITEYNDPNILHELISIKISDLIGKSKIIKNVEAPKKFSIYTRRLFENYMVEIV